jgi:arylsulfatase
MVTLAVFATLFVSSHRVQSTPSHHEHPEGPNVVMIVLDALRADHLSSYGYDRETSPQLDRLANEGVTFLNAHSHGNRTIFAMPALFTSLYPSFNGALSVGALMRPLPENKTTIAEMLQAEGYSTVGIMTNIHLKTVFGMTQGFDRVEEFNGGCYNLSVYKALRILGLIDRPAYAYEGRPRANEITDHALAWLSRLRPDPFFLYVHYMDTHHPYRPPAEFADMFGGITVDPLKLFNDSKQAPSSPESTFSADDMATLRNYYDACIRYSDYEVGRILDKVRELTSERETIVIVTSDHGDEFREHGTIYHNNVLIEELIRVPLIIWAPQQFDNRRDNSLVRHIDVLPTIADMTGSQAPAETMGQSLVPLMSGDSEDLGLSSFAEGDYCTSYIVGGWKMTYVDSTGDAYLYNLDDDPHEQNDLFGIERARANTMLDTLLSYRDKAATARGHMEATEDEETLRQLKALGYINDSENPVRP